MITWLSCIFHPNTLDGDEYIKGKKTTTQMQSVLVKPKLHLNFHSCFIMNLLQDESSSLPVINNKTTVIVVCVVSVTMP